MTTLLLLALGGYGAWGFASAGPKDFKPEADGVEVLLNEAYTPRVLDLIASARERVWLAMYVARYQKSRSYAIENKMFKALVAAHARGVDVRVVFDEGWDWDSKTGKMSNRRSYKNDEAVDYLLEQGVPVRLDSPDRIMHAKTLSVDDRYAVVGSHNWTYSALSKNVEVSVLISRREEAEEISNAFLELWQASQPAN